MLNSIFNPEYDNGVSCILEEMYWAKYFRENVSDIQPNAND